MFSRKVLPLSSARHTALRCVDVIVENASSTIKTFVFEAEPGFFYSPGQHGIFLLSAPGEGNSAQPEKLRRSWTLSVHPTKANGRVVISVLRAAHASRILHETMRPGGSINFMGVAGTFTTSLAVSNRPTLLLAGGIGITPMRAMLPGFIAARRDVGLVYSVRTLSDAAFVTELSELAGCTVTVTATGEPPESVWAGRRGRIDAALIAASAPGGKSVVDCYVYVCGPRPFEDSCRAALLSLGVPTNHVFSESFEKTFEND